MTSYRGGRRIRHVESLLNVEKNGSCLNVVIDIVADTVY